MSSSASEATLHFLDYWRVIRNRAPIILTIFLLTFLTGYVTTVYYITKIYGASSRILVKKKDKTVPVFTNDVGDYFDPIFFETQKQLILSEKVLLPVVQELKLDEVWGQKIGGGQKLTPNLCVDILRGRNLIIDSVRNTNLIDISGRSTDPKEAADIANAVAKSYIEVRRQDEASRAGAGLKQFAEQIENQRREVEQANGKVEELRKSLKIESTGSDEAEQGIIEVELQRKLASFDETKADYDARRIRYEQLKDRPISDLVNTLQQMGIENAQLASVRSQQLSVEAEIERVLKTGYTEDHPQIISLRSNLQKLTEQVNGLVKGTLDAMAIDLEVLKNRLSKLESEVDSLRKKVQEFKSEAWAPFREARLEANRRQNMLDALIIRYKQEQANTNIDGEPVSLIAKALPNDVPVKPDKFVGLMLSAMVGLIIGVALAFFIEYLDTSVKTMDDVERHLGLPVLAVIPQGVSPLILEGPESNHAEGYRILRAKLDLGSRERNSNSITVVSGGPGEGKSTTIFNLAYVCAQSGQNVLLVDADLRRPTIHSILGVKNEYGMADYLLGKASVTELVKSTSIPNLYVLCAGDMPHSQMGLFSSQKLRDFLSELKLHYDLVFCDSPPVLGISDGSVLAQVCDMTLLVIQHRRYPRDISFRARKAVEEVRGRMAGVVLNAVAIKSDEAYYYYSAYGDYYASRKKTSDKPSKQRLNPRIQPQTSHDEVSPSQSDQFTDDSTVGSVENIEQNHKSRHDDTF